MWSLTPIVLTLGRQRQDLEVEDSLTYVESLRPAEATQDSVLTKTVSIIK